MLTSFFPFRSTRYPSHNFQRYYPGSFHVVCNEKSPWIFLCLVVYKKSEALKRAFQNEKYVFFFYSIASRRTYFGHKGMILMFIEILTKKCSKQRFVTKYSIVFFLKIV